MSGECARGWILAAMPNEHEWRRRQLLRRLFDLHGAARRNQVARTTETPSLQTELPAAMHLEGLPLDRVIYPHFLSGPLNVLQRLDFIGFHMKYHMPQIARIKARAAASG